MWHAVYPQTLLSVNPLLNPLCLFLAHFYFRVGIAFQTDNKFSAEIITEEQDVLDVDDILAVCPEEIVRIQLVFKLIH